MTTEKLQHLFARAIMIEGAEIPNGRYTLDIVIGSDDVDVVVISDLQDDPET